MISHEMLCRHDKYSCIRCQHLMENRLGNAEMYPPSPTPPATDRSRTNRCPKIKFDVPWIVILVQFIIIILLALAIFAYFLTRPPSESHLTTRTYENFELQTMSPVTFRRRFKTTSTIPQTVDFVFSEDTIPIITTSRSSTNSTQIIMKKEKELKTILNNSNNNLKHNQNNILEMVESENSVETSEGENYRAAVLTQFSTCSDVGRSILVRGGNAVDAAIGSSFCMMAAFPHKASIAGGMMMLISDSNGTITSINSRETAPMNTNSEQLKKIPLLAKRGPKSVDVPGVLNGLYRAFEKFASHRILWKHLVMPTIQQCLKGFKVSDDLAKYLNIHSRMIRESEYGRKMFNNDKIYCTSLATTLSEINEFENPLEGFYQGEPAQKMVDELQGYLSVSDFEDYESDINPILCSTIDEETNTKVCGPGPPSMFAVLANSYLSTKNLSNLEKVNEITSSNIKSVQKIADPLFYKPSRKYAEELAKNSKKIEIKKDNSVDLEEDGSTDIFIIDENNMTVSLNLSIGDVFGSQVISKNGFFWNNKMRYFDLKNDNLPQSIQSGKASTTVVSPLIITKNDTVLAVSGGSDIIGLVHLLRDITHRNYDASRVSPALFMQNSAILSKSHTHSSKLYSITGY